MTGEHRARAFGLRWRADTPLALFAPDRDFPLDADVLVRRLAALPPRPGGRAINNGELFADGVRFRLGGAAFDMINGQEVRWSGPGDVPPLAFYGTVTGLLLAWRGLVPLHGSAVLLGERGVLIAGPSGAGKSTLCHALVERGGLLVSDDLSALMPMAGDERPLLQPGRPAIRLVDPARDDPADKRLVAPPAVAQDRPVPLTDLVLLQDAAIARGPAAATAALGRQQFRPRWMRSLPGAGARAATVFLAAQRVAIHVLPAAAASGLTPGAKAATIAHLVARARPMDLGASGQ